MIKPHIKVIQRNGTDIFVTSSVVMKEVKRSKTIKDPVFVSQHAGGRRSDEVEYNNLQCLERNEASRGIVRLVLSQNEWLYRCNHKENEAAMPIYFNEWMDTKRQWDSIHRA